MRRWLAIVLLVLLPIQFSWAAAAAYCGHESGAAAQHIGHHEHQHTAADAVDGKAAAQDASLPGGDHADCGFCHLSCAKTLVSDVQVHSPPMSEPQVRFTQRSYLSHLQERIERPNWQLAARFGAVPFT